MFNENNKRKNCSMKIVTGMNQKKDIQVFHGCGDAGATTLGVGAGVSVCLCVCLSVCLCVCMSLCVYVCVCVAAKP